MGITPRKWKLYRKMFYQCFASFSKPGQAEFFSIEELIDHIVGERKSLIRYGDGEFDVIEGKSIHYQEFEPGLSKKLDEIIEEYIQCEEAAGFILAMPALFINCSGFRILFSRLRLSCWSHARFLFHNRYDRNVHYGDAFLFSRENEKSYRRIWIEPDIDKIIFVHNNSKYAREFEETYGLETVFVQIPPQNAYEKADAILQEIKEKAAFDKNVMVLISAGPCGKILAYELAGAGIWAIDTGHCWDEPLDKKK